jgi:SAM-dependent methyltransferase
MSSKAGLKYRAIDLARQHVPEIYFFRQYYRGLSKLGNSYDESQHLFQEFLDLTSNKRCLQIGVKEQHGAKFGPNWVSVDLYDTRDFIDYNYDINDLKFDDESFDAAVCMSILEHVPYPQKAIAELHRVLKPEGYIWVQLPFSFPYHEDPHDYWRVSPDGLRIWMADFDEISCGAFRWTRTALVVSSYFYGKKRIN